MFRRLPGDPSAAVPDPDSAVGPTPALTDDEPEGRGASLPTCLRMLIGPIADEGEGGPRYNSDRPARAASRSLRRSAAGSFSCWQPGHRMALRGKTRRQPLEAHELARHAERLGLGAAGDDELVGARGVAGGVAVEEHRGPGAA